MLPGKNGAITVSRNTDVDCGCISALLLAAETKSPSNLDRAALAQYAAKGLVFANRAKEAIPLAARATTLFEEVILTDPLAVLAAKADLALALACSGRAYWQRATEIWATVMPALQKLAGSSADASALLNHVLCDRHFAAAARAHDKQVRVMALRSAFKAGSKIQHPFLMRIIVDLELAGETTAAV